MSQIRLTCVCEFDQAYSVVVADNGRVAYAYLMFDEDVVADVWLYNQAETPAGAFLNTDDLPALNPAGYIKPGFLMEPVTDPSEVRCEWDETADGMLEVDILIRDKFMAQLIPGAKPGWSVGVAKDGPLALIY